jgi:hypothetical protein
MKTSKRIKKAKWWTFPALFLVLAMPGCGSDAIAPGDKGDFCEKASDCDEGLFCLDNVCTLGKLGPGTT